MLPDINRACLYVKPFQIPFFPFLGMRLEEMQSVMMTKQKLHKLKAEMELN